jgi:hypothetical protein
VQRNVLPWPDRRPGPRRSWTLPAERRSADLFRASGRRGPPPSAPGFPESAGVVSAFRLCVNPSWLMNRSFSRKTQAIQAYYAISELISALIQAQGRPPDCSVLNDEGRAEDPPGLVARPLMSPWKEEVLEELEGGFSSKSAWLSNSRYELSATPVPTVAVADGPPLSPSPSRKPTAIPTDP